MKRSSKVLFPLLKLEKRSMHQQRVCLNCDNLYHRNYVMRMVIFSFLRALTFKGIEYDASQIIVSTGAKQAIAQAVMTLCGKQDEVIVPVPYWTSYREMCAIAGAHCVPIAGSPDNNYKISALELEECLISHPRARALILCYPCNPTGSVYSREELIELCVVLERFPNLWIISDEIYEYIMYESEHVAFASLPNMYSRTVTINGFSKGFRMTGFR